MNPSVLEPASPGAASIFQLFVLTHAIMLAIFLGVFTVLAVALWKFRARPGREVGDPIEGNTPLEIGWTAAPALLLAGIFFLQLQVMNTVEADPAGLAPAAAGGPVRVEAVGRRWWWEFRFPDLGFVTANELYLPQGRAAAFELTADEVIHSFWTPRLHGKRDMVPGKVNQLGFLPAQLGEYTGICTEFCGIQHTWMRYRTVVVPDAEFAAWAQGQQQEAQLPQTSLAERGQQVFFETTCQSCHTIRGAGPAATANSGPDLTHFGSRKYLGAGVALNTPENLAAWLRDPQQVKPGNLMPNQRLTDEQIAALVEYLSGLK